MSHPEERMDAVLKPSRKNDEQPGLGFNFERVPKGKSLRTGEWRSWPRINELERAIHDAVYGRPSRRDVVDRAPLIVRFYAKGVEVTVAVDVGPAATMVMAAISADRGF